MLKNGVGHLGRAVGALDRQILDHCPHPLFCEYGLHLFANVVCQSAFCRQLSGEEWHTLFETGDELHFRHPDKILKANNQQLGIVDEVVFPEGRSESVADLREHSALAEFVRRILQLLLCITSPVFHAERLQELVVGIQTRALKRDALHGETLCGRGLGEGRGGKQEKCKEEGG